MAKILPKKSATVGLLAGTVSALSLLSVATALFAASGKIVIEAENADKIVPHFAVKSTKDKKVPSGKYLECAPESCGDHKKDLKGHATYTFEVKEKGAYTLWLHRWWTDGCGDSVWVQIDGKPAATGAKEGPVCDAKGAYRRNLGHMVGEDGTNDRWAWSKARKLDRALQLAPGKHTLTIYVREDGVRIDQILLTTSRTYVPVRAEKPTQ